MSSNKPAIALLSVPLKESTHLSEKLHEEYTIVTINDLEKLAAYNTIALYAGIKALPENITEWTEKARFLSGDSQIFIIGDLIELSQSQRKELISLGRKKLCGFVDSKTIFNDLFFYSLQVVRSQAIQNKQLSNLKDLILKGEELQVELDFRTKSLERARSLNTNIINSITSGMLIIDVEENILMLNSKAQQIFNLAERDFLAVNYRNVLNTDVAHKIAELNAKVTGYKSLPVNERLFLNDNLILSWKCYPIYEETNNLIGTLHLFDDITNQEIIEQQLFQAEKMATIGTMLSGIAHELRNPLSIISGRIQRILSKRENLDEWTLKYLRSIEEQSERCGYTVNNLLSFSRKDSFNYELYSASRLIEESLNFIDYQNLFDRTEIIKDYTSDALVFCNRPQLIQVFINIFSNAAEAMDGKGTLKISTKSDNNKTYITIIDSGMGIEPQYLKKIFDPFFTTKETGKGTGLGLSIAYRIIQQHKGEITAESVPGKTMFSIILPSRK